jgi:hypothetical protein
MTEDLHRFFMEPAEKLANAKKAVTHRFRDGKGAPIEWEVRPLTYDEVARIRKTSQERKEIGVKGKSMTMDMLDVAKFSVRFSVEATVFPDLKRKDLQDAYGAKGEEALLRKMLTAAELDDYNEFTQSVSGYGEGLGDKVADAKNS